MQTRIFLLLLAVLAFLSALLATRWGVGLSPDSIIYIGGARSLVEREGFSLPSDGTQDRPITHHAPLYAVVLAAGGVAGIDPGIGARWVGAILFGLNTFLVGSLIAQSKKRSEQISWPAVIGALFFAVSVAILEIHSMAWTEALFLLLILLSYFLLVTYIQKGENLRLIFAGILIALALLTRYAGVAFLAAGALALVWFGRGPFRRKVLVALEYTVFGFVPLMVWLLRNISVAGTATSREFAIHPPGIDHLRLLLATASGWLGIPESASGWLKIFPFVLIVILLLYVWISNRPQRRNLPDYFRLCGLAIVIYIAFLVVSITFFDANTQVDNRILSPVLALAIICVAILFEEILQSVRSRVIKIVGLALVTAMILPAAKLGFNFVGAGYDQGIGFNSLAWQHSDVLAAVSALPEGTPLYSNLAEAVYIRTGRPTFRLPAKFDTSNQSPNPNYSEEMGLLRQTIENRDGAIVFIFVIQRSTEAQEAELVEDLQIKPLYDGSDGTIYVSK